MPNVLNEFAGDGVTKTFNFSMTGGYLSRDYVYFFTRPNDDLLNYTPYNDDDVTWLTDFSVRTANPIPVGTTFVILRSTTLDPLVDFQNTSRITEKNLDTATWQSIHIAAETSDTVGRIQVVAKDAKQESAQALAGAQAAAADAATAASSAIDASAAASAAKAAALQAGSDATAAALSAATAAGIADAAAITANTANATATTAAADAATALTSAGTANDTANSAASQADTAVSTANTALSTANAARDASGNAVTTANSAATTANAALTIANEAKDLVDKAVSSGVVSFNGRAGAVTAQEGDYTKAMVGLSNVDNTSDLAKPISTATNAALAANAAADRNRANHTGTQPVSTIAGLGTAATRNVGTESGNVMAVGAFGIGGTQNSAILLNASHNLDNIASCGEYRWDGNPTPANAPYPYAWMKQTSWGGGYQQLVIGSTSGANFYIRTKNNNSDPWGAWMTIATSGNLLTTTGQSTELAMSQKAVTDAITTTRNRANHTGTQPMSSITGVLPVEQLPYRPVQAGGAGGMGLNSLQIGLASNGSDRLLLNVDSTSFADTWPINISGRASHSLGEGQSWQLVSRIQNTTYYNTTGRPICVNIACDGTNVTEEILAVVDGIKFRIAGESSSVSPKVAGSFIVPAGAAYAFRHDRLTLTAVHELR